MSVAAKKWVLQDFDTCACGDYRKDHKDGDGPCAFNHIPGNVHGQSQCFKFRLSKTAVTIPAPYVAQHDGGYAPEVPHNALSDARAIRDALEVRL